MITGFRWSLQGAAPYFGVTPDLLTFGKGMANGFSVAAVVGRRQIMEVGAIDKAGAERTFLLSTTHGGEMSSLGAFIETVSIYKDKEVCAYLWAYGARLRDGLNGIAQELGIEQYFKTDGPAICLNYLTMDSTEKVSPEFRTLFSQEMIKNGVLMPWISISYSHGEKELELTLEAARKSLEVYHRALNEGIDKYLVGPAVKPVFRKYN
jgi:glutamate-1-semialdehyde 2,1-aminomutase